MVERYNRGLRRIWEIEGHTERHHRDDDEFESIGFVASLDDVLFYTREDPNVLEPSTPEHTSLEVLFEMLSQPVWRWRTGYGDGLEDFHEPIGEVYLVGYRDKKSTPDIVSMVGMLYPIMEDLQLYVRILRDIRKVEELTRRPSS